MCTYRKAISISRWPFRSPWRCSIFECGRRGCRSDYAADMEARKRESGIVVSGHHDKDMMGTPSMMNGCGSAALYYPFHLCHQRTLERLLEKHTAVHFRDYMALQLTAMAGLTAYADRMGDQHPDLVRLGR